MTNTDISEHYIKQAGLILDEAKDLLRKGAWNLVVRRELYTQLDAGESLKEAEFILSIAKVE